MKNIIAVLLVILAHLFLSNAVLGQFSETTNYRLIARHSGKVLDVFNASNDDNAVIQQYSLHGAPNQTWRLEPIGDGFYRIVSQQSHKVITVAPSPMSIPRPIVQYQWKGGDNQQWKIEPAGLDYYYLMSKQGGCLDVAGGSTADHALVQIYTCHGGDNQTWQIEALEDFEPIKTTRKALLIANENYREPITTLPGVIEDTKELSDKLRKYGYEVNEVNQGRLYQNLTTKEKMGEVIRNFLNSLKPEDIALFYYAGHGMQFEAQNYLVPTDASIESADEVNSECVQLDQFLLQPLKSRSKGVNIIILDACRDNPPNLLLNKGLTTPSAPPNTYIAYASEPGATTENPSPFTKSLS
jgi:hypothetical protein